MKKFKFQFETIRYPLIIMLIMFLFRGLSNTLLSELIRPLIGGNFNWVIGLMEILQYFSAFVIQYLPFIIVLKYLTSKHSRNSVTVMFIVSYILLLTTTMIVGVQNMPQSAYQSLFGISKHIATSSSTPDIILMPYRIGLFGAVISGVIVHYSFKFTRTRTRYALFRFIDRDILSFILIIIISLLTGLVFSFIWPIIVSSLFAIFEWISKDIYNPANTFIYGLLDRLLSLLDLSPLNRETFWFTASGGSWMSNSGMQYVGDVSIWNATLNEGIFATGFGRFLTPYYIINLFAIPGIIVGLFSLYTNKKERYGNIGILFLLLVFAFISDISLPVEVFLFVMAPLFYFIHLFISAAIFGVLQGLEIFLGSNFISDVSNSALGNGVEFLHYLNNDHLASTVMTLLIFGVIVFMIYFFITKLFYKYMAVGLINKFDIENHVEEFLEIVGGIENIESIDSSPFRIDVKLKRPQMFNYDALEKTNIARVVETRSQYAIYYGTASTMVRKEVITRKQLLEDE